MARRKSKAAPAAGPSKAKLAYAGFFNSNATYYGSFIFGILVLLMAFYLAWPSGGGSAGAPTIAPTPTSVASEPTASPSPQPDGSINGCLPQEAVAATPEQVVLMEYQTEWKAIGQTSIPSSATGGPGVQDPPRCFTRAPEGALYSIATFFAERAQAGSNQGFVDVMTRRCLHDANFTAYTARLLNDSPVVGVPVTVISGYRWMEYAPDRATVELQFKIVTGPTAGQAATNVFSVIWDSNDWLILSPHPDQPTALPGSNLRTFHTWGAR